MSGFLSREPCRKIVPVANPVGVMTGVVDLVLMLVTKKPCFVFRVRTSGPKRFLKEKRY